MRPNNICCIGGNHTGIISSCVIAFKCPDIRVTVVDNEHTISEWNSDNLPFEEPDLDNIIKRCRNRNLFFSSNYASSIREADLIFLPFNIPIKVNMVGKKVFDFGELEKAGKLIAAHAESDKIVVEKSAMAARAVEKITDILDSCSQPGVRHQVLSNPQFTRQGSAVRDLLNPNYVLIGAQRHPSSRAAAQSLCELYEYWVPRQKIVIQSNWSVEVSSLAGNAFLAQKMASINSLASVCEETGNDINKITAIMINDTGLENKILPPLSFGKFQKDLSGLILLCESLSLNEVASYWQAVLEMNYFQISRFLAKINSVLHPLKNKHITVLGFAQDSNTSETKNSLALEVCVWLLQEKCSIRIYDPVVHPEQIKSDLQVDLLQDRKRRIQIFQDIYSACRSSSGIIICTNWDEFLDVDYQKMVRQMKEPIVIDAHNFLNENSLKGTGLKYHTLRLI